MTNLTVGHHFAMILEDREGKSYLELNSTSEDVITKIVFTAFPPVFYQRDDLTLKKIAYKPNYLEDANQSFHYLISRLTRGAMVIAFYRDQENKQQETFVPTLSTLRMFNNSPNIQSPVFILMDEFKSVNEFIDLNTLTKLATSARNTTEIKNLIKFDDINRKFEILNKQP